MTTQTATFRDEALEAKEKRNSFFTSIALLLLFLLATASWWKAVLFPVPPAEQSKYLILGAIDFGNFEEGSGEVNNFLAESPTPGPEKPASSQESNPAPALNNGSQPLITGTEESGVSVPVTQPNENSQSSNTVTESKPVKKHNTALYESHENGTAQVGGANHGEGNKPGNRGNPNSPVLNDDGGPDGVIGGHRFEKLNGRKAVSLPSPVYTVQKEAKLTFKFKIAPSGKVVIVEKPITAYTDLAKSGMDAIYKWKFSVVDEDAGDQWVSVTITFKLK